MLSVPGINNAGKHQACLDLSELNESQANKRREQIRLEELTTFVNRYGENPSKAKLDSLVDARCEKDRYFNGRVSDNKWYISQATMYGIAALLDTLRKGS